MNSKRTNVRLYLLMLLIVLLPVAGFLWAIPSHQVYAYVLGLVCFVLAACIEGLTRLTEREAKVMQIKLNEDKGDLEAWKEKVRELDRIVAQISLENQEFRREALEKALSTASAETARPA